jgi:NAD(P)H-dependent FMN reductase
MSRVLVIPGSTRKESYNRKLAMAAAAALREAGLEVSFTDLRDFPMPLYDGDVEAEHGLPDTAKKLKHELRTHDAFVFASPEYNGSFPAVLKNAIDWATRPESPGERSTAVFRGKTAALLSASPGPGGGKRGLRHLRELLEMIGVNVLEKQLTIGRVGEAFDAAGNLVRAEDAVELDRLVSGLRTALQPASPMAA